MVSTTTDRIAGLSTSVAVKAPCRVVTSANLTLSGEQTVNGTAVVAEDRVLVKDQTDTTENGIYYVSTGVWERAPDFDGNRDVVYGTLVPASAPSAGAFYKVATANPITIGTSAITFSLFYLPDAGFSYAYSTTTTASDPGTGTLRFNHATLASATALYISETTGLSQSIAADIATWDDSTSTIHGKFRMFKQSDPSIFAIFDVTGTLTDNGTWDTLTVAYVTGSGTFANADAVTIQYTRNGDAGATGSTGATGPAGGTTMSINTQTDSYTLVLGDAGYLVAMNKGTALNLTVPPNSSVAFPVGTQILVENTGAGLCTLVAGGGVTLNKPAAFTLVMREQWSMVSVIKKATDTWTVGGDLTLA